MEKLFVLDASGYLYSAYFAIRNMTNREGMSTNAIYGFVRSRGKLIKELGVEHIVAVFDGPNNGKKRKEIYPQYKAHRREMPSDLVYQIDWARSFCSLMGIPFFSEPGVEADDIIGSIAAWSEATGVHLFICSGDKDLCQLVNDRVSILNPDKEHAQIGPKEAQEMHGVPPELIVDYLSLVGDASDNVPGVPGFGPKTASKLLLQFGGLDALLENSAHISEKKKREQLQENEPLARLSRRLVTIDKQIPVPEELAFYKRNEVRREGLAAFYREMNFQSLLKEMEKEWRGDPKILQEAASIQQQYELVDDEDSFVALLKLLSQQTSLCFDTETTALHPLEAELVGIGFGFSPGKAWYIPTNGKLGLQRVLEGIKPLMENDAISFYGHNVKYDIHILRNYSIFPASISFDTIIASYLLYSNERHNSLDALSLKFFNYVKIPIEELIGKGKNSRSMRDVELEKICRYCCEDVDFTCRLKLLLEAEVEARNMCSLLYELETPLLLILVEMERAGIFVDVAHLKRMGERLANEIVLIRSAIFDISGEEFNLNSPRQLGEVFQKLGVNCKKKTATGQLKTDSDVLHSLKKFYPIAGMVLEYRALEKLRSTYIEALPEMINSKSGRIHCTFNQSVAATGRLSCQNPNLQNIPVRSAIGREIREAFMPQKQGWSFLSADYSQIELRLLAHFSEGPNLVEAFWCDKDIHSHTASILFHCPLDAVSVEQRHQAKTVNFGILYGQQAFGLSQELGISLKSAAEFIEMYFARYRNVHTFLEQCKEKARLTGKSATLIGREREIPEICSKNGMLRSAAERLAVNTPIQGSAADLIKMAMLEVQHQLMERSLKSMMIVQVHDELIFEAPDEELEELSVLVKDGMEGVVRLKVPLIVDIAIGKNWKEC